jgi:hypothetical protein
MMHIDWHCFLNNCLYDYPKQYIGILYSENPFSTNDKWHVLEVKNNHTKPEMDFLPDSKDLTNLKFRTKQLKLTKIGVIHSHPYPENTPFFIKTIQELLQPTQTDIENAIRYNDLINCIIVCNKKEILGMRFFRPFTNEEFDIQKYNG